MCMVSMVGDHYKQDIGQTEFWPAIEKINSAIIGSERQKIIDIVRQEMGEDFDKMKAELESIKKLLKAAKIYDDETGQPDCEVDEKVEAIKRMAEILKVDLKDVF